MFGLGPFVEYDDIEPVSVNFDTWTLPRDFNAKSSPVITSLSIRDVPLAKASLWHDVSSLGRGREVNSKMTWRLPTRRTV